MSNQGEPGWFPECLVCGMGNLHGVVCLSPICLEQHVGKWLESPAWSRLEERDGHWWMHCLHCDDPLLADPWSFGTFALCSNCWNRYAKVGKIPPSRPSMRGFDPPPKHPELITAQLGERIRALLEDLVSRVKVGVPGALGAVRNDGLDPNGAHREYATFLASHDGDAITVTILLRHLGPGVVCTAESVREATVIDEMPELRVVGLDPTATAGAILRAVTAFVRSQEDRVVTELKREA